MRTATSLSCVPLSVSERLNQCLWKFVYLSWQLNQSHKFLPSVCACNIAGKGLGKIFPAAMHTSETIDELLDFPMRSVYCEINAGHYSSQIFSFTPFCIIIIRINSLSRAGEPYSNTYPTVAARWTIISRTCARDFLYPEINYPNSIQNSSVIAPLASDRPCRKGWNDGQTGTALPHNLISSGPARHRLGSHFNAFSLLRADAVLHLSTGFHASFFPEITADVSKK
jgi:hypothetical protein